MHFFNTNLNIFVKPNLGTYLIKLYRLVTWGLINTVKYSKYAVTTSIKIFLICFLITLTLVLPVAIHPRVLALSCLAFDLSGIVAAKVAGISLGPKATWAPLWALGLFPLGPLTFDPAAKLAEEMAAGYYRLQQDPRGTWA